LPLDSNALQQVKFCAHVCTFLTEYTKVKQSYLFNRVWRPIGLWDDKDPTLSRQSAHRWLQSCHPYEQAALYSPETLFFCLWYSFLLAAEWTPGHTAAGRIR
jgi:hypothetical protein